MSQPPRQPPAQPPAKEDNSLLLGGDDNEATDPSNPQGQTSRLASKYPQGALIYDAKNAPTAVDVHPLVLLSVVDHFARVNSKVHSRTRVVGLLLGTITIIDGQNHLDVCNCFAVPFDEDPRDPAVWFFDSNYGETMLAMYRKVLPQLKVVGWYSSGPVIAGNDLDVHLLVAERYCPSPVYCMVNTDPANKGMPVETYVTTEAKGTSTLEFRHMLTRIVSLEAEDIAVEHLLRDLTDSTVTTLSTKVADREVALGQLDNLLGMIEAYLTDVADGKLAVCQEVISLLQEVSNALPSVHLLKKHSGMLVHSNDRELVTFVSAAARATTALYDVIVNRRRLKREAKAKKEEAEKKRQEDEQAKKKAAEAAAASTPTAPK